MRAAPILLALTSTMPVHWSPLHNLRTRRQAQLVLCSLFAATKKRSKGALSVERQSRKVWRRACPHSGANKPLANPDASVESISSSPTPTETCVIPDIPAEYPPQMRIAIRPLEPDAEATDTSSRSRRASSPPASSFSATASDQLRNEEQTYHPVENTSCSDNSANQVNDDIVITIQSGDEPVSPADFEGTRSTSQTPLSSNHRLFANASRNNSQPAPVRFQSQGIEMSSTKVARSPLKSTSPPQCSLPSIDNIFQLEASAFSSQLGTEVSPSMGRAEYSTPLPPNQAWAHYMRIPQTSGDFLPTVQSTHMSFNRVDHAPWLDSPVYYSGSETRLSSEHSPASRHINLLQTEHVGTQGSHHSQVHGVLEAGSNGAGLTALDLLLQAAVRDGPIFTEDTVATEEAQTTRVEGFSQTGDPLAMLPSAYPDDPDETTTDMLMGAGRIMYF